MNRYIEKLQGWAIMLVVFFIATRTVNEVFKQTTEYEAYKRRQELMWAASILFTAIGVLYLYHLGLIGA